MLARALAVLLLVGVHATQTDTPARAELLQARAALDDGDMATAESLIQQLLIDFPSSDQLPAALFTLEQVRRAVGDCRGALEALDAYEAQVGSTALGPYTALQRAQCLAKLEDWPGELRAANTALSIEGGAPRLAQIEALERAAEADLALGRQQDALDDYNRSLELAGTRAYRVEMLFTTATLLHELDQDEAATERFRSIVVDYPEQARAPGALAALADMGRAGVVSPYQAGTVRLLAREYAAAVALFEQVDPASPEAGQAKVSHASALVKLDRQDEARQELASVAVEYPDQAASALLRLGQLLEHTGELANAEAAYTRMAQVAPDRAGEALFRAGLTRYVGDDPGGALAYWNAALPWSGGETQAAIEVWRAKVLGTGSAEALAGLSQAALVAPDSYYGLRAQELLGNTAGQFVATVPAGGRLVFEPSPADLQERAAWLAAAHTTPDRIGGELAALPGLQRADRLWELGLRTEAGWEVDAVQRRYAQANDIPHLSALADWVDARGVPQLTLQIGRQERDLVGLGSLPRAVQRQVYPAGFADLAVEQAQRFGVDPLLLLAIVRQESSFNPRAESKAHALGLTQMIPSTARAAAARLGQVDEFATRDLFKPSVSLEFGAWYLRELLDAFQGRLFPALAAYDAGPGNVSRWLQRWGDDPDVLVEEIPFAETQTYLRNVYANYRYYRLLYEA